MPRFLPQDGVDALCWAMAVAIVLECLARVMRRTFQGVGAPRLESEWHGRMWLGWTAQSPENAAPRASRGVGTANDTAAASTGEVERAPAQEDARTQADVHARAPTPAQDGALAPASASAQENAPVQVPEEERAQVQGGGWARARARVWAQAREVILVRTWRERRGGRVDTTDLDSEEYCPRRRGWRGY
ncbi:hypothetical protein BC834DRAFT_847020 [Gloeopeniophorella convolvens]|nr:hypothetical protein BC834DRAFT_847020 [Gloeopeniophorella convolvens]